ncbi:non-motile and phage-resistance protein [bacterium MnTg02]|nr:non-motile and phage-resistance protein [bacterium MnTg02]
MDTTALEQAGSKQPPAHTSHKQAAQWVSDAREQLAYGSRIKPEYEYDLLFMFVNNELGAVLTIPLLAMVLALAAGIWAPANELIFWLTSVFISKGILLALCRMFIKDPRAEAKVAIWRAKLIAAEFLYGVSWASIALVSFDPGEFSAYIFLFASIIVVIAMRVMFASTVMPIVYAGTIPMTLALVLRFMMMEDSFFWAMAAMAVGIHLYFIFLVRGLNGTVVDMLGYKAEKETLIAEIEQAKAHSDEARRRAESANVAKSRFLATISHELRTPLNAILGFSEVMKTEVLGPHQIPTYKEYAEDINVSGQHLLKLINEILDLSRIEAGGYELSESPVNLSEIAEDCCRLIKLRAEKKGQVLEKILDYDLPPLWADERAIRQICLNLLSNAVKFTPAGGHITITTIRSMDGGQTLAIRDTGPGIPKDEIPQVLRTFGQGSLAHETAEGGTGLGLPIVQGLINLHDGMLELKSELRKGTEAIVLFPRKRVMQALPQMPLAEAGDRSRTQQMEKTRSNGQRADKPNTLVNKAQHEKVLNDEEKEMILERIRRRREQSDA